MSEILKKVCILYLLLGYACFDSFVLNIDDFVTLNIYKLIPEIDIRK